MKDILLRIGILIEPEQTALFVQPVYDPAGMPAPSKCDVYINTGRNYP
jgi:hypothetical protein